MHIYNYSQYILVNEILKNNIFYERSHWKGVFNNLVVFYSSFLLICLVMRWYVTFQCFISNDTEASSAHVSEVSFLSYYYQGVI